MHRCMRQTWWMACLLSVALVSCAPSEPPTETPGPPSSSDQGSSVVEFPLVTPSGGSLDSGEPVIIDELVLYKDAEGLFELLLPVGWPESRQPPAEGASDRKVGTVFQPAVGKALLSVTQFDNGQRPQALGSTVNGVLKLTGFTEQPGYRELARETVLERPDEAMRVVVEYERASGTKMSGLLLFQIDGTTFSMLNAAVERSSWAENEGAIRDILASYRVPADS